MSNRNSQVRIDARNRRNYDYGNDPIIFEEYEDLGNIPIDDNVLYESKGATGDIRVILLKRIYGKMQNIMTHLLKLKYSTTGNEGTITHWIDEIVYVFRPAAIQAYTQLNEKKRDKWVEGNILELYCNAIDAYEHDMNNDSSLIKISKILEDEHLLPWNATEVLFEEDTLKLLSELPKSPKPNYIKQHGLPSKYQ